MNRNIRRFFAAVSLAFVLGSTPVVAAPSRDGGRGFEPSPITKVIRAIGRFFHIRALAEIMPPIP